jgi:hypothetical protein
MELIFVYNAKTGLFNKATDFAHKILSPETYNCSLCSITYSNFSIHSEWAEFVRSLKIPVTFLYKNTFKVTYPNIFTDYPVIYLSNGNNLVKLLSASEIGEVNKNGYLRDLIKLIRLKIENINNGNADENE